MDASKPTTFLACFLLVVAVMATTAIPVRAAGSVGNITASSDVIYGNMVLQVTVSDADIAEPTASMPDVECNYQLKVKDDTVDQPSGVQGGYILPTYQATGGSWVGFIALGGATIASTVPASPPPQDGTAPSGGLDADGVTGGLSREPDVSSIDPAAADVAVNDMVAYVQSPDATFTVTYHDSDPVGSMSVTIKVSKTGRTGVIQVDGEPATYQLSAATAKPTYTPGDLVTVTGYLKDGAGNPVMFGMLNLLVKDDLGTSIFADWPTADDAGMFTSSFKLPSSARTGTYSVLVEYAGAAEMTTFVVSQPTYPVTLSPPRMQDANGNTLASGRVGEVVLFATQITNTASTEQAALCILQVKDDGGRVANLGFVSGNLTAGRSITFAVAWTPEGAGTYTVEVFAWRSWDDPSVVSTLPSEATISITP